MTTASRRLRYLRNESDRYVAALVTYAYKRLFVASDTPTSFSGLAIAYDQRHIVSTVLPLEVHLRMAVREYNRRKL